MSGSTGGTMRRRVPWWVLALLFVVLPVVEIFVLIQIGQTIGAWWTILLLVADGVLGSWLMKREGTRAWAALTAALGSGRMPARELADAALILVGGTLLLTPGFVTDILGLFLVVPVTRPVARRMLTRFLTRRLLVATGGLAAPGPHGGTRTRTTRTPGAGTPGAGTGAAGAGPAGARTRPRPGPEGVVRGEVVD